MLAYSHDVSLLPARALPRLLATTKFWGQPVVVGRVAGRRLLPHPRGAPLPRNGNAADDRSIMKRRGGERWKVVAMPYSRAGLTTAEQQMIAKLADACHLMDEHNCISDLGGWAIYHETQNAECIACFPSIAAGGTWPTATHRSSVKSRWYRAMNFIRLGPLSAVIEKYAAAHPEQKAALYVQSVDGGAIGSARHLAPPTEQPVVSVVDHLYTYPYHEAYAEWVKPMVADLRAAAKLARRLLRVI